MFDSVNPSKVMAALAKKDPFVEIFLNDHYLPYIDTLQKLFNEKGLTMVVVPTEDIEPLDVRSADVQS